MDWFRFSDLESIMKRRERWREKETSKKALRRDAFLKLGIDTYNGHCSHCNTPKQTNLFRLTATLEKAALFLLFCIWYFAKKVGQDRGQNRDSLPKQKSWKSISDVQKVHHRLPSQKEKKRGQNKPTHFTAIAPHNFVQKQPEYQLLLSLIEDSLTWMKGSGTQSWW